MIVANLHVIGIAINEPKAYSPLIVDRDGVLSLSVPGQGVQSVAPRNSEIIQPYSQIQILESARRPFGKIRGEALRPPRGVQLLGAPVRERLDHEGNVSRHVTRVNVRIR